MRQKNNRIPLGVIGITGFLVVAGLHVPFGLAGTSVQSISNVEQKDHGNQLTQKGEKENSPTTPPVVPPTNDSEMVIKPDMPPDPDAVVTPPVIDPEMAVDPATRQPMTPEKLERLEKEIPDEGKKGFPDK